MASNERIKITSPGKEELVRVMNDAVRRYRDLHDRVRSNRQHYNQDPAKDPQLLEPLDQFHFQTDIPRKKAQELKARLIENQAVVHFTPHDKLPTHQKAAEAAENVFNTMIPLIEERNGYRLQAGLADGQIIDCYGVLHWRTFFDQYPKVPAREYIKEMPEDATREYVDRFEPKPDDDENEGAFREKASSVLERDKHQKARAGAPWLITTPDPTSIYWIPDAAGLAVVIQIETVGYLNYDDELANHAESPLRLAIQRVEGRPQVRVYTELPKERDDVNVNTVTKATIWYRDFFFEMVSLLDGVSADMTPDAWEIVMSARHPYGEPPFAFAFAELNANQNDMVERYKPALEGMYRMKPHFDKSMSLFLGIGERHALPDVFLVKTKDGVTIQDNDGNDLVLTKDAAAARQLPDGYTLQKIDIEPSDASVESVRFLGEMLEQSAPQTGQAEITATTQPWNARLQQQQASVEPKSLIMQQQQALRKCVRSMADVMGLPAERGGYGTGVWVYKLDMESGEVSSETIGIEPHQIITLNVGISIDNVSSAEKITNTKFGQELLNDPFVPLGRLQFTKEYMGQFHATEIIESYEQEMAWEQIKPGLIQQKLAEVYGTRVVIGADGQFVGVGGQAISPQEVLAQNGIQPIQNSVSTSGTASQIQQPPLTESGSVTPPGVTPQAPLEG